MSISTERILVPKSVIFDAYFPMDVHGIDPEQGGHIGRIMLLNAIPAESPLSTGEQFRLPSDRKALDQLFDVQSDGNIPSDPFLLFCTNFDEQGVITSDGFEEPLMTMSEASPSHDLRAGRVKFETQFGSLKISRLALHNTLDFNNGSSGVRAHTTFFVDKDTEYELHRGADKLGYIEVDNPTLKVPVRQYMDELLREANSYL